MRQQNSMFQTKFRRSPRNPGTRSIFSPTPAYYLAKTTKASNKEGRALWPGSATTARCSSIKLALAPRNKPKTRKRATNPPRPQTLTCLLGIRTLEPSVFLISHSLWVFHVPANKRKPHGRHLEGRWTARGHCSKTSPGTFPVLFPTVGNQPVTAHRDLPSHDGKWASLGVVCGVCWLMTRGEDSTVRSRRFSLARGTENRHVEMWLGTSTCRLAHASIWIMARGRRLGILAAIP